MQYGQRIDHQALLKDFLVFLKSFGDLLNNPKLLAKNIQEAIQLSEDEQAKVEQAKTYITESKQRRDELLNLEKTINDKHAEAVRMLKDQETLYSANKELQAKLEKTSKDHIEKDKFHADKDMSHVKKDRELEAFKAQLHEKEIDLQKKQQSVADHEARTKEQAERLRRAAEGL